MTTTTVALTYTALDWTEIIPGIHQADYLGISLEVEIAFRDRWTIYDVRGDAWLEGFCAGVPDGKIKAFNALKAEIS